MQEVEQLGAWLRAGKGEEEKKAEDEDGFPNMLQTFRNGSSGERAEAGWVWKEG